MRYPVFFPAVLLLFFFQTFQSCKKSSDPVPDPVPVVKPDTLTAGWTKQVMPGETNFADVFFNSSTTGYLLGSKIYKSNDGGNTWLPVLSGINLYNIFMTNDSKAFFVGQNGAVYRTLDGGSSFVNTAIGPTPLDIFFTDNNTGFCITIDGLYTTADAGVTWARITTTGLPSIYSGYASLAFTGNTTGWIVYPGGIFKTNGSATSWQQATVSGGTPAIAFASVFASSATRIYAANNNGEVFRSTDGGANFSYLVKLNEGGFTDIHFLTDLLGYASVGRNVFKTTDGGVNWTKVVSLGQGTLGELHFTDATHGWVGGSDGIILVFKQ